MKRLDYPPIWLVLFLVLAWIVAALSPGLTLTLAWQGPVALLLFLAGAVVMGLAVSQMSRAKTTIVPHRMPDALVRSGVFRLSRNPIYLGDLLILTAFVVWFGVVLALPGLWLFKRLIESRFILPEEARLRERFGDSFEDWAKRTRRWI